MEEHNHNAFDSIFDGVILGIPEFDDMVLSHDDERGEKRTEPSSRDRSARSNKRRKRSEPKQPIDDLKVPEDLSPLEYQISSPFLEHICATSTKFPYPTLAHEAYKKHGLSALANTYICDETPIGRYSAVIAGTAQYIYRSAMRSWVNGRLECFINERLFDGTLVRQTHLADSDGYQLPITPGYKWREVQERDILKPVTHDQMCDKFLRQVPQERNAANQKLRDWLLDVANGVERQDATMPAEMAAWSASFFTFLSGKKEMSVPLSEEQQSIDESMRELKKSNLTLLQGFRWFVRNWRQARDAPVAKHVLNLIGCAIAFGFLPESASEFQWQTFKLYKIKMESFHDITDVLDMCIAALNYFIESSLASWETGDFTPFLYEKTMNATLDEAYELIQNTVNGLSTGAIKANTLHWHDLFTKLEAAQVLHDQAIKIAPPQSMYRRLLQCRSTQIKAWNQDLMRIRSGGDMVKQCPGIVYYGKPGCGKSLLTNLTFRFFAAIFDEDFDPASVADIVPGEAYHSKITMQTRFVRFDDVANRPLALDDSLGIALMLQICNNVQFTAVKAEVENKGKVTPDIGLCVGTTNKASMDMPFLSCDPNSLRRRIYRIDVKVKKKYRNDIGGVDSHAVKSDLNVPRVFLGNIWIKCIQTFTINFVYEKGYAPGVWKGTRLVDLELEMYLKIMEEILKAHDEDQEEHVHSTDGMRFSKCSGCGRVICVCEPRQAPPEKPPPLQPPPPPVPIDKLPTVTIGPMAEPFVATEMNCEKQSADLVTNAVRFTKEQVGGFVLNQAGLVPSFFSMPGMMQNWVVERSIKNFFKFLETQDHLQWWYWIPDEWWDSWFMRAAATVMPPNEIMRKIKWAKRRSLLYMCIAAGAVGYSVYNWRSPGFDGVIYHQLRNACNWFAGRHVLLNNFRCLNPVIKSFTKADAPFFVTIGCMAGWTTESLYCYGWTRHAYKHLSMRRGAISQSAARQRENYAPRIKFLISSLSAAALGYGVYCMWDSILEGLGISEAKKEPDDKPEGKPLVKAKESEEQIFAAKDTEALKRKNEVVDVWKKHSVTVKTSYRNPGMTNHQLRNLVQKNLSVIFRLNDDGEEQFVCNGLWVTTGLMLVPKHIIPTKDERWVVRDNSRNSTETPKTVSADNFVTVKIGDMALMALESRSKKNIIPYFNPDARINTADLMWRSSETLNVDLQLEEIPGIHARDERNGDSPIVIWNWPCDTFLGACGGVYLSRTGIPSIVGIHIGGLLEKKNMAMSYQPTPADFQHMLESLANRPGFMFQAECSEDAVRIVNTSPSFVKTSNVPRYNLLEAVAWLQEKEKEKEKGAPAPEIPDELVPPDDNCGGGGTGSVEGVECIGGTSAENHDEHDEVTIVEVGSAENQSAHQPPHELHENLPSDPGIVVTAADCECQGAEYCGERTNKAFYKTRVQPTIIAPLVQKHWPDLKFAGPKFGRSMWAKSARYSFDTTPGLPMRDMWKSFEDYMTAFTGIDPYLLEYLRPLTWEETINGIDKIRFIDPMNFKSSMGINFPGGKLAWVLEYIDTDTGYLRREFVPMIKEQCQEVLDMLRAGKRVDWLFNATPKDEPTPIDKEKVRLFMVAEITLTLLVRKYFTPVCRIIQMMNIQSECAVGINCVSADWEEVCQHLERFANFFDGDHSKYDLRKNATLSRFSYRIMIEIAAMGDYTPEDLLIMSTMVDSLVSPLVNYNGEVYRLDGSTPSGIPVTVIINSIDNSLINRCAYFNAYPNAKIGSFRRYVSHINYGDDFINSVSWHARKFNFLQMKEYMAKYGMVLTPGIKDAVGRKFIKDKDQLVFLQRQSSKLPELPHRVGKLNEKSIVKSLLSVLRSSSLTPEEAAATNVDGALREWVFHGRDTYEARRQLMKDITEEAGIAHLCTLLHSPFEQTLASLVE